MGKLVGSLVVAAAVLFFESGATAQEATMPVPAEYQGALLARGSLVSFYRSGHVEYGTLGKEFRHGPFTFAPQTRIDFFEDGSVSAGVLLTQVTVGKFTFSPGAVTFHANGQIESASVLKEAVDENLVIPVPARVFFDSNGRIESFSGSTQYSVRVLGRSVRGNAGTVFFYDAEANRYLLESGTTAEPQLVARVVTEYSPSRPVSVVPITVPQDTGFRLPVKDANFYGGQATYERWALKNSSFSLGDMNFGTGPTLLIRDMRLEAVQVVQAVTINGTEYRAGDVIKLDERGRIVPYGSAP